MQLWSEFSESGFRTSDFGLLDPDGDTDRRQNLITWFLGHALPLQEISSKSIHNFFQLSDGQSNKQTDTRRGRSRGVLVADATNFERPNVPNFIEKPPFFFVSEQSRMSTLSVQKV